ncbi:MAG: L-histidine N(alpha)-methyltransferase, partial [Candidatus Micrarchaeota archaeon]
IEKGVAGSEQCFLDPVLYTLITAPMNATEASYAETEILLRNYDSIFKRYIEGSTKVFFGIGNGDTELLIHRLGYNVRKYHEICAIDAQKYYIELYLSGLRKFALGALGKTMFKGLNKFFDDITKETLDFSNSELKRNTLVMLGNSVGNYVDQNEVFDILTRCINENEFLLLGIRLALKKNPELVVENYKDRFYNDMVEVIRRRVGFMSSPRIPITTEKIEWMYDKKENFVKAICGELTLFASKGYDLDEVDEIGKKAGLERVERFTDDLRRYALVIMRKNENRKKVVASQRGTSIKLS